jgi:hypothetical protein
VRFRTINRWYANVGGYFWTDCPLCGQMFGGHEWRDGPNGECSSIPHPDGTSGKGTAICSDCTAQGLGWHRWESA